MTALASLDIRPRPASTRWRHDAALINEPPRESWGAVMDRLCLPYVETAGDLGTPRGNVLWMVSDSGAEFTRIDATPQRIAGRYPEQSTGVWLSAMIQGEAEFEADGERITVLPGAILYGPTGAAASVDYRTPFRQIFVKLPRASIHSRLLSPAALRVGHLDASRGSVRMLFALLKAAAENLDELGADDLRPVEMAVTEFLVSSLAHEGGPSARGGSAGARAAQLSRIRQTIEARLGASEVSLSDVAAAHRISPRYLQKLFKSAGDTFGHYILTRRLERCRADLGSPLHAQLSISEICFRWGFNGSAHFSRVFRERYGASPREFRRAALACAA